MFFFFGKCFEKHFEKSRWRNSFDDKEKGKREKIKGEIERERRKRKRQRKKTER